MIFGDADRERPNHFLRYRLQIESTLSKFVDDSFEHVGFIYATNKEGVYASKLIFDLGRYVVIRFFWFAEKCDL